MSTVTRATATRATVSQAGESQTASRSSGLRIAVFGTGALGCLIAARLAHARVGEVVVWGSWRAALDAIDDTGIVIETGDARLTVSVRARHRDHLATRATDSREAESGGFDLVLVLVKSWQTKRVAETVARAVSSRGLVVSLQNGLGNREALAEWLNDSHLATGVTAVGARLIAPGHVRAGGDGGTVLAPPVGAALDDERLECTARAFRQAGLTVHTVANAGPAVWSKLAVNCAINPLSALARVSNGVLIETPPRRELMTGIAHEVERVALAQGMVFDHDPATRALEVAAATATNHSSMLQDVLAGRRTEIDALCGAVVDQAEAAGIDVPLNRILAERVRGLDANRNVSPRMAGADPSRLADLEAMASTHAPRAVA